PDSGEGEAGRKEAGSARRLGGGESGLHAPPAAPQVPAGLGARRQARRHASRPDLRGEQLGRHLLGGGSQDRSGPEPAGDPVGGDPLRVDGFLTPDPASGNHTPAFGGGLAPFPARDLRSTTGYAKTQMDTRRRK